MDTRSSDAATLPAPVPPRPPRPSSAEVERRVAAGRAARKVVPRSTLADWEPAGDRKDPVRVLEGQIPSRIHELIPIRHQRMLADPFAFYRGGAAIMAEDLAPTPTSGLRVQACGDAHLANFGVFGAPDRALVFDLNDFDETHPGPWEWDVKRLAVSAVLLARSRGWGPEAEASLARSTAWAYRVAMHEFSEITNLDLWYARITDERILSVLPDGPALKRAAHTFDKARHNDAARAVGKFTEVVGGRRRIIHQPPLVARLEQVLPEERIERWHRALPGMFEQYLDSLPPHLRVLVSEYEILDMAVKVVGVGSVGTRCVIALAQGRDPEDLFFFQIKEAQESVLAPHVQPAHYDSQGERVVLGQQLMQSASDIFLGWASGQEDYYVRQFRDMKGGFEPAKLREGAAQGYMLLCGWTLARAHARSGDRIALASYLGSGDRFERAITRFSLAYAEQVEQDYAAFADAAASGRIEVAPG
jgi:uncharacterized protein (DUF2252 family)